MIWHSNSWIWHSVLVWLRIRKPPPALTPELIVRLAMESLENNLAMKERANG